MRHVTHVNTSRRVSYTSHTSNAHQTQLSTAPARYKSTCVCSATRESSFANSLLQCRLMKALLRCTLMEDFCNADTWPSCNADTWKTFAMQMFAMQTHESAFAIHATLLQCRHMQALSFALQTRESAFAMQTLGKLLQCRHMTLLQCRHVKALSFAMQAHEISASSFTSLHCNKYEKRPISIRKETYYNMKRDLLQYRKRPIAIRITCLYCKHLWRVCIATNMKRDLLVYEKRPITIKIMCLYCKHLTPSVLQTRHVFAFFHESALQESHVSA